MTNYADMNTWLLSGTQRPDFEMRFGIHEELRARQKNIERLKKDRDLWKRRADQRQITINELKQNPLAETIMDIREQALLKVLREIVTLMEDKHEMIYPHLDALIDDLERAQTIQGEDE